jgi:hypothetical protein
MRAGERLCEWIHMADDAVHGVVHGLDRDVFLGKHAEFIAQRIDAVLVDPLARQRRCRSKGGCRFSKATALWNL